jgi:transposase-like protein
MTRYSAEEKAAWLEQWKTSGKGAWVFAEEHGIRGQTFSQWVKKQESGGRQFVEIRAERIACCAGEIVVEKGGIKVRLPLGMSGKEIRAVMEGTGVLP